MTNHKHTPGPWNIDNPYATYYCVLGLDDQYLVAADIHDQYDARLIAAAPELLEALEACEKAHVMRLHYLLSDDPEQSVERHGEWWSANEEATELRRAAIAKATGGEQ